MSHLPGTAKYVIALAALPCALALAAASARAADLYIPDDIAPIDDPSGGDFGGAHVGATLGVESVNVDVDGTHAMDGAALLGGLYAGYDYQYDSLVLGAEADVDASGFSKTVTCPNPAWQCTGSVGALGSLRGRLGFASNSMLYYATGGVALGSVGGYTDNGIAKFPDQQLRTGWTAGGGVEGAIAGNWIARVEYRYTDLGSADMHFDSTYPAVHFTTQSIRLGVAYRF